MPNPIFALRRYHKIPPVVAASSYPNLAASFGGASSLRKTDTASLSCSGTDFTLACWFQCANFDNTQGILSKNDPGSNTREYLIDITTAGQPRLWVSQDGNSADLVQWSSALSLSTWYYVVCGYRVAANQIWMSINGAARQTAVHSTGCFDSNSQFALGANYSGTFQYLTGYVDEAALWKREISTAETTQLYNAAVGYTYSDLDAGLLTSLISWWKLNEATGATSWVDSHGTNHLTNNGTINSVAGKR